MNSKKTQPEKAAAKPAAAKPGKKPATPAKPTMKPQPKGKS